MAKQRNYKTNFDTETEVFSKEFTDGTKIEVDVSKLPEVSRLHVLGYGITQIMNDCHSGESDLGEIIRISSNKAEDLQNGIVRARRGEGLGLGVNIEVLTKALAAVQFKGNEEQASEALSKFIPDEDDDEEVVKKKKAKLRAIRNAGVVKAKIDELQGKTLDKLLG